MSLRYNHLKFDLKFFWRSVYGPQRWSQRVKNGQSFHNPPAGRERERRDSSSTLQSGNVRRMERNVAWSSVGKNSQPSHWRGLRAKLTVWYTIQYTLHYTASLYLLSRHRDINMKHCNTLRWPGLTSLQLEHNINHNGEKNEFLWLFNV